MNIADLGRRALTRANGRLAAQEFIRHLKPATSFELALNHEGPLSLSFIDGLVLSLHAAEVLDQVIFVPASREASDKLARIAGIHPEIQIWVRSETGKSRRLRAKAPRFKDPDAEEKPTT